MKLVTGMLLVLGVLLFSTQAIFPVEPAAHGGEKLLLGFEKETIKQAVADRKGLVYEEKEGEIHFWEARRIGGYSWLWAQPYVASKEKVTEGEYALKHIVPIQNGWPQRPDPDTRRNWALFSTFGGDSSYYDAFFPRDWSGYARLRLDLRVERPETGYETSIWLQFSDEALDPPIKRTYTVPAEKWVTLEVDLERAVTECGLALDRMNYLLIVLGPEQKARPPRSRTDLEQGIFYLDNIRLAKRDTRAKHMVLRDESSFKVKLPRAYAVEYKVIEGKQGRVGIGWQFASMEMPEPVQVKLASVPNRLEPPKVIELSAFDGLSALGLLLGDEVAALDSKRILVPFRLTTLERWYPAHDSVMYVLGTTDGGDTWKGPDGTDRPFPISISHHRVGFPIAVGGELLTFSDFGCQGTGHSYPIDKGFVRRTVFSGDRWWISPYYFVDPHEHHCVNFQTALGLASGRVWVAWGNKWYRAPTPVCAKYSDDGGRTWQSWGEPGKIPRIPGLEQMSSLNLVPYGEHVAVILREGYRKAVWTSFDGKAWSEPMDCPVPFKQLAVSVGGKEIYISGEGSVWRWDGKTWSRELETTPHPKGEFTARLAVSGKTVLCFDLSLDRKKLLCWEKTTGGAWQGPEELASEETAIQDVTVQRYPPTDFVPVAYTCKQKEEVVQELIKQGANPRKVPRLKPWIKLLKVPARTPLVEARD